MKRNGFTLVEFVVVVVIICILAAMLYPVLSSRPHRNGGRAWCQSNLKQVALGFKIYTSDYNDRFPPVSVTRSGYWAGSLQPYVKAWQVFQCPSTSKAKPKTTDYFYNSRLAALEEKKIPSPSQTILAAEGRDDSPTNYALSDLPPAWRQSANTPATRHLDGANYAFADGHVKWLKPESVSAKSPSASNFTFALR